MHTLDIVAITASVVLVLFVIEAIRRSRLNARYAILWLGAGGVLLLFSLYRPLLDWVAQAARHQLPAVAALRARLPVPAGDRAALLAGDLVAPRLDPPPDADGRAARARARTSGASAERRAGTTVERCRAPAALQPEPRRRRAAGADAARCRSSRCRPATWRTHALPLATLAAAGDRALPAQPATARSSIDDPNAVSQSTLDPPLTPLGPFPDPQHAAADRLLLRGQLRDRRPRSVVVPPHQHPAARRQRAAALRHRLGDVRLGAVGAPLRRRALPRWRGRPRRCSPRIRWPAKRSPTSPAAAKCWPRSGSCSRWAASSSPRRRRAPALAARRHRRCCRWRPRPASAARRSPP